MFYVIFDLEWNNAYNYKLKKGMNEIIEIGAIKLDEKLNIVDTFKQLIKPKLSNKLSSRFKNLTHISMDEINDSELLLKMLLKILQDGAEERTVFFLAGQTVIFMYL